MNKYSGEGFTLIDLLVALIIGGSILAIIIGIATTSQQPLVSPVEYLEEFSGKANITPLGCLDVDSDGDGYVSCTARDNITQQLIDVQCAYSRWTSGCKLSKTVVDN